MVRSKSRVLYSHWVRIVRYRYYTRVSEVIQASVPTAEPVVGITNIVGFEVLDAGKVGLTSPERGFGYIGHCVLVFPVDIVPAFAAYCTVGMVQGPVHLEPGRHKLV